MISNFYVYVMLRDVSGREEGDCPRYSRSSSAKGTGAKKNQKLDRATDKTLPEADRKLNVDCADEAS